jgi:hypothetical protein
MICGTGDDSKDFALGADQNNARHSCNVSDRPRCTIEHNTSDLGGRRWMVMAGLANSATSPVTASQGGFPERVSEESEGHTC